MVESNSKVAVSSTNDRKTGVVSAISALKINPVKNKDVLIKPNFNTADKTPGSTHNDTLTALVAQVWEMGAKSITLGERSYPETAGVMAQKGVLPLMKKQGVRVIDFDTLDLVDWIQVDLEDSHWQDGIRVARPVLEAECLISTCCLKTHQYGGLFTMSLKNHVGIVPTFRHGFNYMKELHESPFQQEMIAELNTPITPDLIVLDGVDAFVDGGPMTGKRVTGDVMLASNDRVAIDAVGVAVLKYLGSNSQIMNTKIFDMKQIARAGSLGLGASSPDQIQLVASDDASAEYTNRIESILKQG